jgi:SAM-dependent methyltransferase
MRSDRAGSGSVPDEHPDRLRWNAKYTGDSVPSFAPHPLARRALSMELPDGPLAELACGPSAAALLAAASGRRVTAVDVSEVALGLLDAQARRRGLDRLITPVHADLAAWQPAARSHALVLCTGFWTAAVFAVAVQAVADGGMVAWEAFTVEARQSRPHLPAQWCLGPGEPAVLLPPDFTLLEQHDRGVKRQVLARRQS